MKVVQRPVQRSRITKALPNLNQYCTGGTQRARRTTTLHSSIVHMVQTQITLLPRNTFTCFKSLRHVSLIFTRRFQLVSEKQFDMHYGGVSMPRREHRCGALVRLCACTIVRRHVPKLNFVVYEVFILTLRNKSSVPKKTKQNKTKTKTKTNKQQQQQQMSFSAG